MSYLLLTAGETKMLATLKYMRESSNTIKKWLWFVPCNKYMAQYMQHVLALNGAEEALAIWQASRQLCRNYGIDTQ